MDLVGKGGHVRTVPVPDWVKQRIDDWRRSTDIVNGCVFRSINKCGIVWGTGLTEKVIWNVVKTFAKQAGFEKVVPHDLRRTCAACIGADNGALSWVQAKDQKRRE